MARWIAIPVAAVATWLCFVGALALAFTHATPPDPDSGAIDDIPASLLPVYRAAAATCPGLEWPVLAAIGWVESHHGQGRADPTTGQVAPPILGPPLDGRDGRARILDAHQPGGYARALGPMQFLSTTWAVWGRLAPGRTGPPDIHNAWDAIHSAAAYLCGAAGRITDLHAAILRYNRSERYVAEVLAKAATYAAGRGDGALAWPVPGPVASGFGNRLHPILGVWRFHAGIDLSAPAGAPVHAAASGVVTRAGGEGGCGYSISIEHPGGLRTRYCHLSRIDLTVHQAIVGGQVIGLVGSTGLSTGPHLHFEVYRNGQVVDPLTSLPRR